MLDDDYHDIIRVVTRIDDTGKTTINNAIVRMTQEEIKSLYDSSFTSIVATDIGARRGSDTAAALNSMNFGITKRLYVGVIVARDCHHHKKIYVSQFTHYWFDKIKHHVKSYTGVVYLIKYIDGKLVKWDARDDVLDKKPWRKFYHDVICADRNSDPFKP